VAPQVSPWPSSDFADQYQRAGVATRLARPDRGQPVGCPADRSGVDRLFPDRGELTTSLEESNELSGVASTRRSKPGLMREIRSFAVSRRDSTRPSRMGNTTSRSRWNSSPSAARNVRSHSKRSLSVCPIELCVRIVEGAKQSLMAPSITARCFVTGMGSANKSTLDPNGRAADLQ
jgi:hypothetical protein